LPAAVRGGGSACVEVGGDLPVAAASSRSDADTREDPGRNGWFAPGWRGRTSSTVISGSTTADRTGRPG